MSREITLLHPSLQQIVVQFQAQTQAKGLPVSITQTLRTEKEQNDLYAQGRTAPGSIVTNAVFPKSSHCWGIAFDFCRNDGKGAYNDSDGFFAKVGAVGRALGLDWGGDWKSFPDKPHLEWTALGQWDQLLKKYRSPKEFIRSWTIVAEEKKEKEDAIMIYNFVDESMPEWAHATIQKLMQKGYLRGNEKGELGLTDVELKIFVVNDRAGCYDK